MTVRTRTRQLPNGKWIGECKTWIFGRWWAVDAVNPRYGWGPGSPFYGHCMVDTQESAETAIKNTLAVYHAANRTPAG